MNNKKIHKEVNIFKDDEEENCLVQEVCDSSRIKNEHGRAKVSMYEKKIDSKNNAKQIQIWVHLNMYNNVECFDVLSKGGDLGKLTIENKKNMNIEGIGRTCLKVYSRVTKIWLNMMYIPKCVNNIISLGKSTIQVYKFIDKNNWCKVYNKGRLILEEREYYQCIKQAY